MKTKARDIVEGWPRGTSSSKTYDNDVRIAFVRTGIQGRIRAAYNVRQEPESEAMQMLEMLRWQQMTIAKGLGLSLDRLNIKLSL